jgi:hypothetical protein
MIILERFCDHPSLGTLGEIYIHGTFFCFTIEQPYRDNKPFKSSIPVGEYKLIQYDSPTYGDSLAFYNPLLNVMVYKDDAQENDRYACLIHSANWASQLQGCVALGSSISWGDHKGESNIMVTNSKSTLKRFREQVKENDQILIKWKHA